MAKSALQKRKYNQMRYKLKKKSRVSMDQKKRSPSSNVVFINVEPDCSGTEIDLPTVTDPLAFKPDDKQLVRQMLSCSHRGDNWKERLPSPNELLIKSESDCFGKEIDLPTVTDPLALKQEVVMHDDTQLLPQILNCSNNGDDSNLDISNVAGAFAFKQEFHIPDDMEQKLNLSNSTNMLCKPLAAVLRQMPITVSCEFYCKFCDREFVSKSQFICHNEEFSLRYSCNRCRGNFKLKYSLKRHYRNFHSQFYKEKFATDTFRHLYNCCGGVYSNLQQFNSHMSGVHYVRPEHAFEFLCRSCNSSFSDKDLCKKHMRDEHDKKVKYKSVIHKCKLCSNVSRNMRSLKRHVKFVHEEHVICNLCGARFKNGYGLNVHQKICGKKGYPCKFCDLLFMNPCIHRRHLGYVHSNKCNPSKSKISVDFGFQTCKYCSNKFGNTYNLYTHEQNLHEKKLECYYCGKKLPVRYKEGGVQKWNVTTVEKDLIQKKH